MGEPLFVEWGVVLDDLGSTDVYPTREEAESANKHYGSLGEVVRIETWPATDNSRVIDQGDHQTLREAYKNLGAKYETLRAKHDAHGWPSTDAEYREDARVALAAARAGGDGEAEVDPTPLERLADSFGGATEVDRLAIALMRAWAKADPGSGVAQNPASYVATFADMARAAPAHPAPEAAPPTPTEGCDCRHDTDRYPHMIGCPEA